LITTKKFIKLAFDSTPKTELTNLELESIIAIILGRPAGGKTQVISLLRKWIYAYYTDSFSAKSWITHTTSVKNKDELEAIDMLPSIKNKIFCTPEWEPIFTLREEDLRAILGIITRIADGQGLATNSGVYGRRAYEGIHMFSWIGAAVDVPYLVYKVLGTLGQKLYFFRLPFEESSSYNITQDLGTDFTTKFDAIQSALFDYLKWFEIGPDLKHDDRDGILEVEDVTAEKDLRYKPGVPGNQFKMMRKKKFNLEHGKTKDTRLLKIEWDRDRDDSKAKQCIAELAVLLSHLRCDVKTWKEGDDIGYAPSLPEHPKRAAEIMFNLAKGHALLYGRNFVTMQDVPIVIKTVLSTAEIERVKVFSLLRANKEGAWLSTSKITQSLSISPQTARRKMTEFVAIHLVDDEYTGANHERSIKLRPEFKWFLSEEFNQLNGGFEPADYHDYLKEDITSVIADHHSPTPSTFEFGLDFLLKHFQGNLYPRTISIKLTKGAQITVHSKEEALAKFKAADYLDCRINPYPKCVELKGINLQTPDFLFIDLDQGKFKSRKELDKALANTCNNINEKFKDNETPTILWSGHEYHIYLPVDAFILEKESEFNRFGNPSRKFIQFAEEFLSDRKADPEHTKGLSFKNCMLRIPGSFNSKEKDGLEQVLIVQSWDGYRPNIRPLFYRFDLYLIVSKSNELHKSKHKQKSYQPRYSTDWSREKKK
jgi:hypothetical protein